MSNKPTLPGAYVDFNNRNLGIPAGLETGIFAFIGIAQGGTATYDAIVALNKGDVAGQIGYGELADELLDFFDAGGRKALAVPIDITTEATGTGAMTPTRVGTSTGTIALDKVAGLKITGGFEVQVEITATQTTTAGQAMFKYSLDGGTTFSPEIVLGATYTIPGTNIELTFTDGAGATEWEDGDVFDLSIAKPLALTGDLTGAVTTLLNSTEEFDAIVMVPDASAALGASMQTAIEGAEASPNFRYCYGMIHGALASSDMSDLVSGYTTIRASVESDRMQIVSAEAVMTRVNHGSCQVEKTCIGVISGRRSALERKNDLGRVDAGLLPNVVSLRTNMTTTLIETLDGLRTVTIRQFKGVAGFRPTNGWMTDPFSDFKKDAWRILADDAATLARTTALGYLKTEVDPADVSGSTVMLQKSVQNAISIGLARQITGVTVNVPDNPNILTDETLLMELELGIYGHASWIGITVAMENPNAA